MSTQNPIIEELARCRTFRDAVSVAEKLWNHEADRLIQLSLWTIQVLALDAKTAPFIRSLLDGDENKNLWTSWNTNALKTALVEYHRQKKVETKHNKVYSKDRKTQFNQQKEAAYKSLLAARELIDKVKFHDALLPLIWETGAYMFFDHVAGFHRVKKESSTRFETKELSPNRRLAAHAVTAALYRIPTLRDLLDAAARELEQISAPPVRRYDTRGVYLRTLFSNLKYSDIGADRVEFLTHVSRVVFGVAVQKKSLATTIKDLVDAENQLDIELKDENPIDMRRNSRECDLRRFNVFATIPGMITRDDLFVMTLQAQLAKMEEQSARKDNES